MLKFLRQTNSGVDVRLDFLFQAFYPMSDTHEINNGDKLVSDIYIVPLYLFAYVYRN